MCAALVLSTTAAWAKDKHTTASAEAAFIRVTEYTSSRQWALLYRNLNPAQRALLTKDNFAACSDVRIPAGMSIEDLEFTAHYKETLRVPGTDVRVKSIALTVKFTTVLGSVTQTTTDTVHVVWVHNKWTWVMDQALVDKCVTPSGSA